MSTIILAPKPRRFLPMEEILNLSVELPKGKGKESSTSSSTSSINSTSKQKLTIVEKSNIDKSSNDKSEVSSIRVSMEKLDIPMDNTLRSE